MMISLQTAQTYYQKLHKTIPNDTTLSLAGVGEALCKITDGCRLEEAFHTDLSFAATVALLRYMLEDDLLDHLALKMNAGQQFFQLKARPKICVILLPMT